MKTPALIAGALLALSGCATRHVDHFYVIDTQPGGDRGSNTAFARQVTLRVSVPSLVDRPEMVISVPDGVALAEHERWAAPLSDLIASALSRDIERQRNDVVVLPHRSDQAAVPLTEITVDVDEIRARLGDQVTVEVHWRIVDARGGQVHLGRDRFASPAHLQNYASLASALSSCISLLADRLVKEIPQG